MHEMKVYDGHGNLKETVPADKCLEQFWSEFEDVSLQVHDEVSLKASAGVIFPGQNKPTRSDMVCVFCKKTYTGVLKSKFCPDRSGAETKDHCRNKHYARLRAAVIHPPRPCVRCNKMFTPTRGGSQKLCRKPCDKRLAVTKTYTYKCVLCFADFESHLPRKLAKYCHKPCTRTLMVKKRSRKSKEGASGKVCLGCGDNIEHLHKGRVFCGSPCDSGRYEKKLNEQSLVDIKNEGRG